MAAQDESLTRTHEPGLREITVDLDGLRLLLSAKMESLKELLNERDRFYLVQFKASETAVNAALAAAKEQVSSTFNSSEKAIVKAENAQKDYNERTNEFRGQLSDQAKLFIPRLEVETIVRVLEEKIARTELDLRSLRESRSESLGKGINIREFLGYAFAIIGLLLAALSWALKV